MASAVKWRETSVGSTVQKTRRYCTVFGVDLDADCFKPQRADCSSKLMTCVLAKPVYLREAEQQLSEQRRACEHTQTQTHACIGVALARTTLSSRWRASALTLMVLGFSEASTISFSLFKPLRQKQHFKVVRAAAGAV